MFLPVVLKTRVRDVTERRDRLQYSCMDERLSHQSKRSFPVVLVG